MSDVQVTRAAAEEVARALYGDGTWEIMRSLSVDNSEKAVAASTAELSGERPSPVAKARGSVGGAALSDTERKNREKLQAQVGLASNIVGLAAGVGGTAAAMRDDRFKAGGKLSRKFHQAGERIPKPLSGRTGKTGAMLAGGALGLQVANIAGDTVANRVLARAAHNDKKKKVTKALGVLKPVQTPKMPKGIKLPTKPKTLTAPKPAMPRLSSVVKPKVATMVKKDFEFTVSGEISKSNDKRQVFGWASVVEIDGQPVVDLQGDYATIDVIEKAAYEYVHSSRKGGDMHSRSGAEVIHKSDLVESFVVTPEKKKMLGLPDSTPTGWWVGFQVHDDDLWQLVKDGKRPQFSIHGSGQRVEKDL